MGDWLKIWAWVGSRMGGSRMGGDRVHGDEVDDEHAARLGRGAGQALSRANVVPVVEVRARASLQQGQRTFYKVREHSARSENILHGQITPSGTINAQASDERSFRISRPPRQ